MFLKYFQFIHIMDIPFYIEYKVFYCVSVFQGVQEHVCFERNRRNLLQYKDLQTTSPLQSCMHFLSNWIGVIDRGPRLVQKGFLLKSVNWEEQMYRDVIVSNMRSCFENAIKKRGEKRKEASRRVYLYHYLFVYSYVLYSNESNYLYVRSWSKDLSRIQRSCTEQSSQTESLFTT